MLISKQNILKLKSEFKIERVYNAFVILIISAILFFGFQSLHKPIKTQYYRHIVALSQQANNPKTQIMAKRILQQPEIDLGDYLKLMHAYQFEKSQARYYPAISLDDPQ